MRMVNSTFAHYEGNCLATGWQNNWHGEYYRVEGEDGVVLVDNDHKVKILRHIPGQETTTQEIPHVPAVPWDGHNAIIYQFLEWLDDGPIPPTVISDNIKTAAMLFGAIEASATNQTVDVVAKVQSVLG